MTTGIASKTVAIVGGGPGGLTLARLLQMRGVAVKVYERDADRAARVQGAPLDLHTESGLKALEAAGLMETFRANYRPGADAQMILDRLGNVVLSEAAGGDLREERPEIDRGPLRDLLLDSLAPGTVVWGSQFKSLTRQDDGLRLEFADGTSARADIVIGADGANSRIRPFVTSRQPIYSGITLVEGTVRNAAADTPRIHERVGIGKIIALGDEKALFVISKGDGSLIFYASRLAPESWVRDGGLDFTDKAAMLAWFREEFHGWSDLWDALFQNADGAFVPRPQYFLPTDPPWEARSDITLLGDAAHVMPPFAGEGVNMAMLDALELADCLTGDDFPDTRAAIAAYEGRMRERITEVMEMTREQTEAFHAPNALGWIVEFFTPPRDV